MVPELEEMAAMYKSWPPEVQLIWDQAAEEGAAKIAHLVDAMIMFDLQQVIERNGPHWVQHIADIDAKPVFKENLESGRSGDT
jgi:hypothetical protein